MGVPAVAAAGALASVGVEDVPPAEGVVVEEGDARGAAPVGLGNDVGDCGLSGPDAWRAESSLIMTLLRCRRAATRFSSLGDNLEACWGEL